MAFGAKRSTRNHFVEPPAFLDRLLAALPPGLADYVQRILEGRWGVTSRRLYSGMGLPRAKFNWKSWVSLPNFCILLWAIVLLWGERWIFQSSVDECRWDKWSRWPPEATPHQLIFIADPQLIDPHSYPDRPWPLSSLTYLHTDNYMKRAYIALQQKLHPDTVFFLGDLFDGGREWEPREASHEDPAWAHGHRPSREAVHRENWIKNYGEEFWLHEYDRFGRIFFNHFNDGGEQAGPGQRGRRVISSLPGNHDLGFGAHIKLPVRNRFRAYFGENNRVDIIGNHSFVSVDTVSLSARDMDQSIVNTSAIHGPVEDFLHNLPATSRRALARELRVSRHESEIPLQQHGVVDLYTQGFNMTSIDPGAHSSPTLPTILLTHVPLYRPSNTPCGAFREHGTSISVSAGYQYQNVLSSTTTSLLFDSISSIAHVFSADDHDYCSLLHDPSDPGNPNSEKSTIREITVKAMSWAMGIRTPGFMMASLWNPLTPNGESLGTSTGHGNGHANPSSSSSTIQTHLCLLPDQLGIFIRYGMVLGLTLLLLISRALLMPFFGLKTNFPERVKGVTSGRGTRARNYSLSLPSYLSNATMKDGIKKFDDENEKDRRATTGVANAAERDANCGMRTQGARGASGTAANGERRGTRSRAATLNGGTPTKTPTRSPSGNGNVNGYGYGNGYGSLPPINYAGKYEYDDNGKSKTSFADDDTDEFEGGAGLGIGVAFEDFSSEKDRGYEKDKLGRKAEEKKRAVMMVVLREVGWSVWRVAWPVVGWYLWLAWRG